MRANVLLWSAGTPGLASMRYFESFPLDIVEFFFFQRGYSVFFRYFIIQPELTLDSYETNEKNITYDTHV